VVYPPNKISHHAARSRLDNRPNIDRLQEHLGRPGRVSRQPTFPADSEDLVLRFEFERLRFQTWAANAGLTEGTFAAGLVPIHETVERQLRLTGSLVLDLDQLRRRYGLSAPQMEDAPEERVTKFIAKMKTSLRAAGIKVDAPAADENQTGGEPQTDRALPTRLRRMRWALRDRKRFEDLLSALEGDVDKLINLLTETQQRTARKDYERINILVIGNVEDDQSLQLIREAIQQKPEGSAVRTLVERKAIAEDNSWNSRAGLLSLSPLRLEDFILPTGYQLQNRFFATTSVDPEKCVLFQRKTFGVDVTEPEKSVLRARIQRLVLLLSGPRTESFRTPHALAFIHDPKNFCWWLVFDWTLSSPSEVEVRFCGHSTNIATSVVPLQAQASARATPTTS
jgi:Prion-inhibition and propagation